MRTIRKGAEPSSLSAWKRANPHKTYARLCPEVRQSIRQQSLEEQYYLCAYCCQRINNSIKDCHNEHLEAQNLNPKRTLDFTNLVASCEIEGQCGKAHKSQHLPLTPSMEACETELRFKTNGLVEGLSDRAITMIEILNLGDHEKNNKSLIERRRVLVNALLLWEYGVDPTIGLEDEDLLISLIEVLDKPQQGKLDEFAPVVINILRTWLSPQSNIRR
jgi:uncharacterized protein (TIGR02646 family)